MPSNFIDFGLGDTGEKKYRSFSDVNSARRNLYDRVLSTLTTKYPIENARYRLELSDVDYEDKDPWDDLTTQKRHILDRKTLSRRLRGKWRLVDKASDKVVDETDPMVVAHVPVLTGRGTIIYRGREYTVSNQMRLRPGVFTRRKENGELEAHVNVIPGTGRGFRLFMEPETGVYRMRVGQANLKLYPILRELGVSDDTIRKYWGDGVWQENVGASDTTSFAKAVQRLVGNRRSSPQYKDMSDREVLLATFKRMEMDPDVTSRTLGKGYTNVTPEVLLRTTEKLNQVRHGEADNDDRDSMAFQRTYGVEDLFSERINRDVGDVGRRMLWRATNRGSLGSVPSGVLTPQLDEVILSSGLANPLEETNAVEMLDHLHRVTRMGEGGIPSAESIPDEARAVQPSHLGFIDPIKGPECYDELTEVFTKEGWVRWEDVTDTTLLACQVDGALQFHRPNRLIVSDYEGTMYGVKTGHPRAHHRVIDFLVTPNHRIWTRPYDAADSSYRVELAEDHFQKYGRKYLISCDPLERKEHTAFRRHHYQTHYAGKVYCATVPGGLLFVRRNGSHGIWMGNSSKLGVDLRTSFTAVKDDKGVVHTLMKDRSGKFKLVNPAQAVDSVVAFPGEMERIERGDSKLVRAMTGGKIRYVKPDRVDYYLPHGSQMFSPTSNLVPLISGIKGGRLLMGSKYWTQALPMQEPEAPYVQSAIEGEDISFANLYGEFAGAIRAKKPGRVVSVSSDAIQVRYEDGQKEKIPVYNNFPWNRRTFIHSTPTVQPGDTFGPGQLLARSNQTDGEGTLALGRNLRVGYLPYKGSVAANTHVLWYTPEGAPKFTMCREVAADYGMSAVSMDTDTQRVSVSKVRGYWAHEANELLEIVTSSGRRLRATDCHSFVTLGDNGELVESAGGQLRPGVDWIPRAGRIELPETVDTIHAVSPRRSKGLLIHLDAEFGFLCGLYAAEGYVRSNKQVEWAVTDTVLRAHVVDLVRHVGLSCKDNLKYPNIISAYNAPVARWLKTNCGHLAANKQVPDVAFAAPISFRRGFVAGYWAGDGRVHAKSTGIPCDTDTMTTSRKLRDGLGLLMASLGISTTHGEYKDDAYTNGVVYRLGVSCRDVHLMPEFPHTDKWNRLQSIIASYRNTGSADHIPLFSSVREKYGQLAIGKGKKTYNRVQRQASKGKTAGRRDVLSLVPADSTDVDLRRLRDLAKSDMEWDLVRSVERTDNEDGWVYDFDMAPTQTFMCVDTLVVHNSNYEDATVISEGAARKLTSEQMYQQSLDPDDNTTIRKRDFLAQFPRVYVKQQLDNFTDDGVIKPGVRVQPGDPVILAVRKSTPKGLGALHRRQKSRWSDASVTWDHDNEGEVTDVSNTRNGVVVTIKSYNPVAVGDKLAGFYGDKGVVSAIVPDDKMPQDSQGRPLEVLLNPLGVISRGNPAQMVEAALGKIVEKTGKPYKLSGFSHEDRVEFAMRELAKHGLSDTEDVYDPENDRKIKDVFVGNRYILRLHHLAESKGTGRGEEGGFTAEDQPSRGGAAGSKRLGNLELNSLLSAGATEVLRDAKLIRGQKNEDFWRAFRMGYPPPSPRIPFMYDKFISHLRGAGINVEKEGDYTNIMALTSKDIDDLSRGEITVPDTLKDNLDPVKGGLFDLGITGGHQGDGWAHISLNEPMPNPIMEDPIRRLLGMTRQQYYDTIAGRSTINGKAGGAAIKEALTRMNVDEEIDRVREVIRSGAKSKRDDAVKKLRYLTMFNETGIQPEDLVWDKVPVLPPSYRPISRMDGIQLISDANLLYKELMLNNQNLADLKSEIGTAEPSFTADTRESVYKSMKAVAGLGDPVQPELQEKNVSGLLSQVFGGGGPKCYDDDTEVLTKSGWVPWPEYDGYDPVGTVNMETGEFEWQLPDDVIHQRYMGYMVHTLSSRIDLLVTPTHRHLLSRRSFKGRNGERSRYHPFRKEMAHALIGKTSDHVRMMTAATGWSGTRPSYSWEGRPVDNVALAEFCGWYLAEGWTHPDGYNVYICQAVGNTENIQRIDSVMERLGMDFRRDVYHKDRNYPDHFLTKEGCVYWSVASVEFVRWVERHMGRLSGDKFISAEIMEWDGDLLRKLFAAYLDGDGHSIDRPHDNAADNMTGYNRSDITQRRSRFSTTSMKLLEDLQIIGLKVGVRVKLTDTRLPDGNANTSYRAAVWGFNYMVLTKDQSQFVWYDGHVHCATVPNGTLVVRRNGIPAVSGNSGSYQRKVLSGPVGFVGRGVITPDPALDMDHVGIPEDKAWTIYKPFIVRRLVRKGMPAMTAVQKINDKAAEARKALIDEMNYRPVIINRAPTLHRYGIMAAWPTLVDDHTLHISPVVTPGFGADFDGDAMQYHVPISDEAVSEAVEKLMPSRNLKSVSQFKVHYTPKQEYLHGLYTATSSKAGSRRSTRVFDSPESAIAAFKRGEINPGDRVEIRS